MMEVDCALRSIPTSLFADCGLLQTRLMISGELWLKHNARRLDKARRLLTPAVAGMEGVWADVGCGDGVFTYLLLDLLQPGSEVYAVDKSQSTLQRLQQHLAGSVPADKLHPILADFTRSLSLPPLDGMLLANSLHFVRHKAPLLKQLIRLLKPGGRMIVIEYNTNQGNSAVPYPLNETDFLTLALDTGLLQPQIVTKAPSSFLGEMYTGMGQVSLLEE
jgi:ubiquinone/menaquinone biosynthesis C-methylase UbiE